LWVDGRRNTMYSQIKRPAPGQKVIWFHAASLGEFEQGRPVIEAWKEFHPEWFILVSFFSPSGYEIRKNYPNAHQVIYLPADLPRKVNEFLHVFHPDIAVFIKYEFWFNYLNAMHKRGVPVYYISTIFRPGQHFFKVWGGWFRKNLKTVRHFFVQQPESAGLLHSIGINQVSVSGDTRFDRVAAIHSESKSIPLAAHFKKNSIVMVAGSTWPEDEKIILSMPCKLIIAPHEIDAGRIEEMARHQSRSCIRFSQYSLEDHAGYDVLIIDNIGMLSSLYRYGDLMYIGGGFGKGIHNILEAAAFGGPVFFGPVYQKFQEAMDLVSLGGAFPVQSSQQLEELLQNYLNDAQDRQTKADICRNFILHHLGATKLIINTINHDNSL
jgi:3-deoxy-D-manno-octulosonic-acid transferase